MSKATKIPSNIIPNEDSNDLKGFIIAYKSYLTQKATDVEHGEKMLELGAKTSLVQEFEQILVNPIQNLVDIRKTLDLNLTQIIDRFITLFITKTVQQGLITSAFRKVREGTSLYYGIVLANDTFENREKVLDFLSFYYTLEFAEKTPVVFQFMSEELKDSFKKIENLA